LPISLMLAALGLSNYAYTFWTAHTFTNMSALMLVSALLTFLIGILAEQISSLHYRTVDHDTERQTPP
ncbi:MAG: glycosyltransferase family 2 protein, partial [Gammaproteobacteria bacterium]|nr:glycosyltransferase family 2 protein [Gammaproteobacteria bacterium]